MSTTLQNAITLNTANPPSSWMGMGNEPLLSFSVDVNMYALLKNAGYSDAEIRIMRDTPSAIFEPGHADKRTSSIDTSDHPQHRVLATLATRRIKDTLSALCQARTNSVETFDIREIDENPTFTVGCTVPASHIIEMEKLLAPLGAKRKEDFAAPASEECKPLHAIDGALPTNPDELTTLLNRQLQRSLNHRAGLAAQTGEPLSAVTLLPEDSSLWRDAGNKDKCNLVLRVDFSTLLHRAGYTDLQDFAHIMRNTTGFPRGRVTLDTLAQDAIDSSLRSLCGASISTTSPSDTELELRINVPIEHAMAMAPLFGDVPRQGGFTEPVAAQQKPLATDGQNDVTDQASLLRRLNAALELAVDSRLTPKAAALQQFARVA